MQLKFNKTINMEAICRLFKETFGASLFWHTTPGGMALFHIGRGEPLDAGQQELLRSRYKPNSVL